ncbi:hypothetical protein [Streptomyces sp. WAC00263]|uniref:hypothetical protein n=1 Tax=Streptomyces sp. WAC00263 TaxID=1917422 RepID=UPI001F50B477|nr:hypothetical protein [Streptomyces sp. WAC00263]
MNVSLAVRSLRAAVFAVLCVLLAAGGHALAMGAAPPVRVQVLGAPCGCRSSALCRSSWSAVCWAGGSVRWSLSALGRSRPREACTWRSTPVGRRP